MEKERVLSFSAAVVANWFPATKPRRLLAECRWSILLYTKNFVRKVLT